MPPLLDRTETPSASVFLQTCSLRSPMHAKGATEPGCVDLLASRSTKLTTTRRSRLLSTCERGPAAALETRVAPRSQRTAAASLRRLVKPIHAHHWLQSEELLNRGCRPRLPRRQHGNQSPVLADAILAPPQGSGRRRPGTGCSSLLRGPFAFCSLKPLDHVGREWVLGLEFLVEAVLIFQVGFDFLWMF